MFMYPVDWLFFTLPRNARLKNEKKDDRVFVEATVKVT